MKSLAEAALLAPQAGLDLTGPGPSAKRGQSGATVPSDYGGANYRGQLTALARRLTT